MLVLLDQNVPIGVRRILTNHDVRTAYRMGWADLSNRELIDAAQAAGIAVLATCDQNIVFQQSLSGSQIAIVVLATNSWAVIRTEPRRIEDAVVAATAGSFTIVWYNGRRK
jgi:predicted nuclease of predicted toxin-antitoxin system